MEASMEKRKNVKRSASTLEDLLKNYYRKEIYSPREDAGFTQHNESYQTLPLKLDKEQC